MSGDEAVRAGDEDEGAGGEGGGGCHGWRIGVGFWGLKVFGGTMLWTVSIVMYCFET